MRKWFSYIVLFLVTLLLSCNKESVQLPGSCIELTVVSDDSKETKAPAEGIDDYLHENRITYVDFYFYPGGDTDSPATYHVRKASGKNKSDVFRLDLGPTVVNTLIFPKHDDVDIHTCKVFALVNYPGDSPNVGANGELDHTSLPELKALLVNTNFVFPQFNNEDLTKRNSHYHSDFMMSGEISLQLRGRTMVVAASGTIDVERYACKLTVSVNVKDAVPVGNDTWMPMLSGMEIYLVNAMSVVTLGGRLDGIDENEIPLVRKEHYFSFKDNPMRFCETDQDGSLKPLCGKTGEYYDTYPFYMYPQKWKHSSVEAPDAEPYLKLVIPWVLVSYDEEGNIHARNQKQFYYKIVIPDDTRTPSEAYRCQFVRNNWYHMNIDVSILGMETDEARVDSGISLYVVYWQDKNMVVKNSEIGKARYLSVDRDEVEIHNIPSVDIAYASSHPTSVIDVRATCPYYGDLRPNSSHMDEDDPQVVKGPGGKGFVRRAGANDSHGYANGKYYLDFSTQAKTENWITLNENDSYIEFRHPINNNFSDAAFDYAPYHVSFSLAHTDQIDPEDPEKVPEYKSDVTIIQEPGIFIEVWENSDANNNHNGYVYLDGTQYKRTTSYDIVSQWYINNRGYVFDRQYPNTSRLVPELRDLQWRVINYTGGSKDLYRINITVLPRSEELPEGVDFAIGDPRMTTVDNLVDEHSFLGKKRFHGRPVSDEEVPFYEENPPEDSNYWNTWSQTAWTSIYNKFGNPKPAEASVPVSWPAENNQAWTEARALESISKDSEGNVTYHYASSPRQLENYYPAERSDRTANLMSPSYLIASKYGGVEYYNGTPYEDAVYRCACYQEDGYPAGRWRLPTKGEIRFIAMLSANKVFTYLFSPGGYYWSANGAVHVTNNGVEDADSEEYALGRCVYDIWYWGEDDRLPEGSEREIFTWGDKAR